MHWQYNSSQLRRYRFNLDMFVLQTLGPTLGFSSEFRPIDQLQPLLANSPAVQKFVTMGMPSFTFAYTLDDKTKAAKLQAALYCSNHKLAESAAERLLELISKDVKHGFSLPISKDTARQIRGGAAQSLDLVSQQSLEGSHDPIPLVCCS